MKITSYALVCTAVLAACSATRGPDNSNQLAFTVRHSPTIRIDPDIRRQSNALHHYLLGQITFSEEKYDDAIDHLAKAAELIDTPAPSLHQQLASMYLREGKLEDALSHCDKALQESSLDLRMALTRAAVLDALNRLEEAATAYEGVLKEHEERQDVYLLLSSIYTALGYYDKAFDVLTRAERQVITSPLLVTLRAWIFEEQGRLDQALAQVEIQHRAEPTNPRFLLDEARLLIKQGKIERAQKVVTDLQRFAREDPELIKLSEHLSASPPESEAALDYINSLEKGDIRTRVRFRVALSHLERQDLEEAERELSLVLARHPNHLDARYFLATVLAASGRRKEGVAELQKISEADEMYVKAQTLAGFLQRQEGLDEAAEKSLRNAYRKAPHNSQILTYLISVLKDLAKYNEAEVLIEEALKMEPSNERLLFEYAVVLYSQQKERESIRVVEQLIKLNPGHADALNFLAYSYAESDSELERARELIERALAIKPNDGFYLDTLGWILFKQKKFHDAVDILTRAAEASGNDPEILEHLGDALLETGKRDRAKEVYTLGIEKLSSKETEASAEQRRKDKEIEERLRSKLEVSSN